MQFNQIIYFLRTCDTLNFTRAAEICNVSQPSLSASIRKLEEELGGELLTRERRSIALTPLGIAMRDHFSKIEQARNAAKGAASKIVQSNNTVTNLGLMCTLSPKPLLPTIVSLAENGAELELLIHDIRHSNVQELLLSNALDCIVMALGENLPDRLVAYKLLEEPMVLAMSDSHHLCSLDRVDLADLNGVAYINRLKCESGSKFYDEIALRKIGLQTILHSEREDLVQDLVAEGVGVSMMPESAAIDAKLTTRVISDMQINRKISIVTLKNHNLNKGTVQLIDKIRDAHSCDSSELIIDEIQG